MQARPFVNVYFLKKRLYAAIAPWYNPPMRIFDTHAHICDPAFDEDRAQLLAEALPAAGVEGFVDVCCALCDWERTAAVLAAAPRAYAALGVHPEFAAAFSPSDIDAIEAHFQKEARLVAWGEIGLDYHYADGAPRDMQKECFALQLAAACAKGRPVVLHVREAFGDCLDILRAHRGKGLCGVMHCFSGSVETARECLDLGLYIAVGGALTFKNARKLPEVVRYVPRERLLVETDCPYLAPAPFRGKRCDPSMLPFTIRRMAEYREEDAEELAEALFENALAVFGLRG